jgi:tetratricopeptide (TPR) repeat protein
MSSYAPPGLLSVILAMTFASVPPATAQEELYQQGNVLYQEGDFTGAIDAYLATLEAGFNSGNLYYNLGNAYFKSGELGRSILSYERALRLEPRDPDVEANLELARSLTADEIEPLPRFWVLSAISWWVDLLPRGSLILIVAMTYLAAVGGLCARILSLQPGVRHAGAWLAGGSGVLLFILGTTLLAREGVFGRTERGIILAEEVAVQSAPSGDDNLTLFRVHEGTRVRVDQSTDTWLEIVLDDGKVGWIPSDALETI